MRLLGCLILLVVAGVGANFLDNLRQQLKERLNSTHLADQDSNAVERIRNGRQKMRERLRNSFRGVDPEARRQRLANMTTRFHRRTQQLTPEQRVELEQRRAKIPKIVPDASPKELEDDLFKLNENQGVTEYMFQGDINLDENQLNVMDKDDDDEGKRVKRQVTTVAPRWTSNVVNYYMDSSINARKRASIAAGLSFLQSTTCLTFTQSTTARNRIRVFSGAGCFSNVGMIGGEQTLSLGDGCEVIGTVVHEFSHALGVWHTQMRTDRDTYVTIDLSAVNPDLQLNFNKLAASQATNVVPYDYGSYMHYGADAFVNRGGSPSIVPKDIAYQYTMGNRMLTFYDVDMINKAYSCYSRCPTPPACQNGGVVNPRTCNTCNCPNGYAGALCNQRPAGCGETLTATADWQTKQFSYGNPNDQTNVRDDFTLCNHWISAAAGRRIEVRVTSMFNSQCNFGCVFNGIEIKTKADQRTTNPKICCPQFQNVVYQSALNPTPIISFNRFFYTTFTIQYRAV